MFEAIKKLFKKEEPIVIEMSEESKKKAKEYYDMAIEAHEKGEVRECRDESGKLIGFFGPAGIERVDYTYEERAMLHKVLERLDRIESALNIENKE